ncbi:MAG: SagB/ThcOx family dehydrogenase [Anaerolineales bacterium]|nr:SagB/ThcOx family dehydrogenase [Anaerolineales bacterium]
MPSTTGQARSAAVNKEGIGDAFQRETRYRRGYLPDGRLDWARRPEPYKLYPDRPQIALSAPETRDGGGIWAVLRDRRSIRRYQEDGLREVELSQLLWAAQGITRTGGGASFRTAPSAGALYPIETYLAIHAVEGIASGVYHYAVEAHALEQLKTGDCRLDVARAALDQEMAYHGDVVFVWTAVFERSKWKYGQRAYRYIYLDAGHIAQNVALGAVALGLGSCQIAALYDDEVNALIDVDGERESTIYMAAVGRRRT